MSPVQLKKTGQTQSRYKGNFKRDVLRIWDVAGLEARAVILESICSHKIRFQGDDRDVLVNAMSGGK